MFPPRAISRQTELPRSCFRVCAAALIILLISVTPTRASSPKHWHILGDAAVPSFGYPRDLAVDTSGNVYVGDANFREVQKLSPTGRVLARWPIGAPGQLQPNGLGRSACCLAVDRQENIYVTVRTNAATIVRKLTSSGKPARQWTPPRMDPYIGGGLATDVQGNIYMADHDHGRIEKLSPTGRVLARWRSKMFGRGFNGPADLAIDGQGHIYVTDTESRIAKLSPSGTLIASWTTIGQQAGRRDYPHAIDVDGAGNVYVVERDYAIGSSIERQVIQKLSPGGVALARWRIPLRSRSGSEAAPIAVTQQGTVYVTDADRQISVFSSVGQLLATWGRGGSAPGQFWSPEGIAIGNQGTIVVADTNNHRIQELSPAGTVLNVWGTRGSAPGQFLYPSGVAVDVHGDLYVADTGNGRVQKLSATGRPLAVWGSKGQNSGQFVRPRGIALDVHGNVYVADTGNSRIQRLTSGAHQFNSWGSRFRRVVPVSLAIDDNGNVYVGEMVTYRPGTAYAPGSILVEKLSPAGALIPSFRPSEGPSTYAQSGVAVDHHGHLFATDSDSNRLGSYHAVWEYSAAGKVLGTWGNQGDRAGHFYFPQALAVNARGAVYVADTGNSRIAVLNGP